MAIGDITRFTGSSDVLGNSQTIDCDYTDTDYSRGDNGSSSSSGAITLNVGTYIIMYTEYFSTIDITNNERINIIGRIESDTEGVIGGHSHGYIRKSSGQQSCLLTGFCIHRVSLLGDTIRVKAQRTDNSTSGVVNRDSGNITILEVDNTNDFGFYSSTSSQAVSNSTEITCDLNTTKFDSGPISRSGNAVSISQTGQYLVCYSFGATTTLNGREEVLGRLKVNGNQIGARTYSYSRGADECQEIGNSWMGVVNLSAGDLLTLTYQVPTVQTFNTDPGARVQLWKLPAGAETFVINAVDGDIAVGPFEWDSAESIDSSFSYTANSESIGLNQPQNSLLCFSTLSSTGPGDPQRFNPLMSFYLDDIKDSFGQADAYHRGAGSGYIALTAGGFYQPGSSFKVNIETTSAVAGTVGVRNGRLSGIRLESIFGAYPAAPKILSYPDFIGEGGQFTITGYNLEASQGQVYVSQDDSLDTGSDASQSIVSWSDTEIVFNFDNFATIPDGTVYIYIVTNSGVILPSLFSSKNIPELLGIYNQQNYNHFWRLDSDHNDEIGSANWNQFIPSTATAGVLTPVQISRGTSNSAYFSDSLQRTECPDQSDMNLNQTSERTMGGWIRLESIQKELSSIYKEGGGVNNIAFLMGVGNVLMAQMADTSDDNVQAYSDFRLKPNRPYHIAFRFSYNETPKEFRLFIDGQLQSVTFGNPLLATDLDAHSGDIVWGDSDSTLEMGGTDVGFEGQSGCYYSQWFSGANYSLEEDIYNIFLSTALPLYTISSQADLDAIANSAIPDCPMALRINSDAPSNISLDNVVFDEGITCQIFYIGSKNINLTVSGDTNLDPSKIKYLSNGLINIIQAVDVEINVKDSVDKSPLVGSNVRLVADSGGPLQALDTPVSITRSGTVATVTTAKTPNLLKAGQKIWIQDADQEEYNGIHTITSVNGQEYTFNFAGSASNATGPITETAVISFATTDSNGKISSVLSYSEPQPISGICRKPDGLKYKESQFSGQILSSGFSADIFMLRDI